MHEVVDRSPQTLHLIGPVHRGLRVSYPRRSLLGDAAYRYRAPPDHFDLSYGGRAVRGRDDVRSVVSDLVDSSLGSLVGNWPGGRHDESSAGRSVVVTADRQSLVRLKSTDRTCSASSPSAVRIPGLRIAELAETYLYLLDLVVRQIVLRRIDDYGRRVGQRREQTLPLDVCRRQTSVVLICPVSSAIVVQRHVGPVLALDRADQSARLEEADHDLDVTRHAALRHVRHELGGGAEPDLGALVAQNLRKSPRAGSQSAVLVDALSSRQKSHARDRVALVTVLRRAAPLGYGQTRIDRRPEFLRLSRVKLAIEDVTLEQKVRRVTVGLERIAGSLYLHEGEHAGRRYSGGVSRRRDLQCYPVAEHLSFPCVVAVNHSVVGSPNIAPVTPPDRLLVYGVISSLRFSHARANADTAIHGDFLTKWLSPVIGTPHSITRS